MLRARRRGRCRCGHARPVSCSVHHPGQLGQRHVQLLLDLGAMSFSTGRIPAEPPAPEGVSRKRVGELQCADLGVEHRELALGTGSLCSAMRLQRCQLQPLLAQSHVGDAGALVGQRGTWHDQPGSLALQLGGRHHYRKLAGSRGWVPSIERIFPGDFRSVISGRNTSFLARLQIGTPGAKVSPALRSGVRFFCR